MKRLPFIPTLFVAAAVAVMIGLGIWQLQRAQWKDALLAEYAAAAAMPALDLDPLLARMPDPAPPLTFRRALVTCRVSNAEPIVRGGQSASGQGGYVSLIPCQPGAAGLAGRLLINAGWSPLPDRTRRLSLDGTVAGVLGPLQVESPWVLTAATPSAPLAASAPPSIDQVPNNHRMYAAQWFFFAGLAVLIYVLALRRRRRELPPEP